MDTYTVDVTRADGLWSAIVHGLPPNTFAGYDFEHFADVHAGVHEALVDLLHRSDFALEWAYTGTGHDYTMTLSDVLELDERLESLRSQLDTARRKAIVDMQGAGLSYRDIGDAMGMSHQRVAQLNTGVRSATGRWEMRRYGHHSANVLYTLYDIDGRIVLRVVRPGTARREPIDRIRDALGLDEDPRPDVPIEYVEG